MELHPITTWLCSLCRAAESPPTPSNPIKAFLVPDAWKFIFCTLCSRTGTMPPRRRTNASERLQEQLSAGDTYGALQTARAVFARLESQGKGSEGRELILTVARSFAEKGELQSVVDLAKLYMTNNSERSGISDASKPDIALSEHGYSRGGRDNILALATCMPPSSEKVSLLGALSKWGLEELKQPDGQVCLELADAQREIRSYASAAHRLVMAGPDGAPAYMGLLKEWMETGYRSEVDLFVCRAIILLLGRGDYQYGRALYHAVEVDAELSGRLSESPLFHMVGILLDLIEVRQEQASQKAFEALRGLYQPTIKRDTELGSALTRIGEGFFGIHPPPNLFASLLNSMLGGGGLGGGMPLGLH